MIPARMGSKRIKHKNIRLLNNKPLISYIIESVVNSNCFDEIYINSEDDIFKDICSEYSVNFYKRPNHLSSDTATNDEFVLDFINSNNFKDSNLFQILPTSPFLSAEEIKNFVNAFYERQCTTLISVVENKIECMYAGLPINFKCLEPTPPSQHLHPVLSYACALMGWNIKNYLRNTRLYKCGYHGGNFHDTKTTIDTFTLKGLSCIDIDNESDFQLAEAIMRSNYKSKNFTPTYYNKTKQRVEDDVPSILVRDGVPNNDLHDCNKEVVHVPDILKSKRLFKSWSKRIINTDSNSATLIQQLPGEGNRRHYHPNWNEWWYIIDGDWEWEVEGEIKKVSKGDVVLIEKNKKHKITAVGTKPAIRLAVSREDVPHIYED